MLQSGRGKRSKGLSPLSSRCGVPGFFSSKSTLLKFSVQSSAPSPSLGPSYGRDTLLGLRPGKGVSAVMRELSFEAKNGPHPKTAGEACPEAGAGGG